MVIAKQQTSVRSLPAVETVGKSVKVLTPQFSLNLEDSMSYRPSTLAYALPLTG